MNYSTTPIEVMNSTELVEKLFGTDRWVHYFLSKGKLPAEFCRNCDAEFDSFLEEHQFDARVSEAKEAVDSTHPEVVSRAARRLNEFLNELHEFADQKGILYRADNHADMEAFLEREDLSEVSETEVALNLFGSMFGQATFMLFYRASIFTLLQQEGKVAVKAEE